MLAVNQNTFIKTSLYSFLMGAACTALFTLIAFTTVETEEVDHADLQTSAQHFRFDNLGTKKDLALLKKLKGLPTRVSR